MVYVKIILKDLKWIIELKPKHEILITKIITIAKEKTCNKIKCSKRTDFLELINLIRSSINTERFSHFFKGSLELMVISVVNPLKEKYMEDFHQQALRLADTYSINETVKSFSETISQCRKNLIDNFIDELSKTLSFPPNSAVIRNAKAQVTIVLKSIVFENQFALRKNLEEKNQAMKEQIEKIIAENLENEEKNKEAMDNLKKVQQQLSDDLEKRMSEILEESKTKITQLNEQIESLVPRVLESYRMAAVQGNLQAQVNLASCYENGWGISKDDSMAFNYYKLSADAGHSEAQCIVGKYYRNGIGVPQDRNKSLKYFELSANTGNETAKNNLKLVMNEFKLASSDIIMGPEIGRASFGIIYECYYVLY